MLSEFSLCLLFDTFVISLFSACRVYMFFFGDECIIVMYMILDK